MNKKPRNPRNPTHLEIGARIRAAREAKRWKLKDLTEATHGALAENRISNYENGIRGPDAAVCKLLAQVLEVNFHWLRFGDEPREIPKSQVNYSPFGIAETGENYAVPLVGWRDVLLAPLAETHEPTCCSIPHGPGAFALILEEDDMFPEYRAGDYIVVNPDVVPADGDDVIAIGPDRTAMLRRLEEGSGGRFLVALDLSRPDSRIPQTEEYALVGTVVFQGRIRLKR
jgi:SOS-response transcriptional repressor LexA